MSRWESWTFGGLHALLAVTGSVYLYMKHFLDTDDPFAVVNHPWQPTMLAAHVMLAPLAMMLFGVVLRSHVLGRLASATRYARRSGWTSLLSFGLMATSGYVLQVLTEPAWLWAAVVTHIATSSVFVVGFGAHLFLAWRGRRAALMPASDVAEVAGSPLLS